MGRIYRADALLEAAQEGRLTRRGVIKRAAALGISAPIFATLLAACGGDDDDETGADEAGSTDNASTPEADSTTTESAGEDSATDTEEGGTSESTTGEESESTEPAAEGQPGGTLRVAMVGQPPTLDIHQTTGTIVALVVWNVYETLFSWDEEFAITPMLSESHEVSDDGLLITLHLRQGVPFHNGEEMKAADVAASIEHWSQISGLGESLLQSTDEMAEVDDYTIEFRMNKPFGAFSPILSTSSGGCAIYPKSVIDAAGGAASGNEIKDVVGTGPYKFVERQPGSHIRLERFDDYAALPGEPVGYGGHKMAYVDAMLFNPVPDEAARIAGIQAGDYHFLEDVSSDQHEVLKEAPNVVSKILPPAGWGIFILNLTSPVMSNVKLRQAFQAALDLESICIAGYGEGFYRLSPSLMQEETVWATDAGGDSYNVNDPELARQLLEESGYDGAEIRWTTTKEYQDHYNRSVTAAQQLKDVGFNINLVTMDWATVLSQQFDKDAWDVTTTGISFDADPTTLFILDVCHVAGWWCDDKVKELVGQLRSESDFDVRYPIWEDIQQLAYEQVPFIKDGDQSSVQVSSSAVHGLSEQSQIGPILWNVWLEQ